MYRFESSGPLCAPASALDLRFHYCGTMECDHSRGWGPALRDHYRLHFVQEGTGQLLCRGQSWDLGPGCCFLISPGELAAYRPDQGRTWNYHWVAFDGLNAPSYLRRAGFSAGRPVRPAPDGAAVAAAFGRMFAASTVRSSGDLRMLAELHGLLAGLMDTAAAGRSPENGESGGRIYVTKAIEWLEMNYPRDISIAELVGHIGLNGKYFSRLFRLETGRSPQAFLIGLRLDKACELMRDPAPAIGDIARSVGYGDQLLFSRMFRKQKGMSPLAYRKALAGGG
jgi:AraC-like DNA-binding protein